MEQLGFALYNLMLGRGAMDLFISGILKSSVFSHQRLVWCRSGIAWPAVLFFTFPLPLGYVVAFRRSGASRRISFESILGSSLFLSCGAKKENFSTVSAFLFFLSASDDEYLESRVCYQG